MIHKNVIRFPRRGASTAITADELSKGVETYEVEGTVKGVVVYHADIRKRKTLTEFLAAVEAAWKKHLRLARDK